MTVRIRFPRKKRKRRQKTDSELDNWELPTRSRPFGFMAKLFGGKSAQVVEALSNPARPLRTVPEVSNARPSPTESDIESSGAADRSEDTSSRPQQQQQNAPPFRTRKALSPRSTHHEAMLSVRQASRWSASTTREIGADTGISQSFATPLAAEGEGSVFPVDLDLDRRRELEESLVRRFDRPAINSKMGEFWFLVDTTWMNDWVNFITGKAGPPGMISNYNLFNQRRASTAEKREAMLVKHAADYRHRGGVMANRPGLTLKKGLKKIRDYRALHPLTWYMFREMYTTDGAPDVCRWEVDIYSDEVTALHKKRVEQATRIKASYELRRFAAWLKEEMQRPS